MIVNNSQKYKYKVYKTHHKRFTPPFYGKFFSLDDDTLDQRFIMQEKDAFINCCFKNLDQKKASIFYYHEYVEASLKSVVLKEAYLYLLQHHKIFLNILYEYTMKYSFEKALKQTFSALKKHNVFVEFEDLMYPFTKQGSVFIVALKKAYLEYISQHVEVPIVIATKFFFQEGFVEIEKNVAAWYITNEDISEEDMQLLYDQAIVYNMPLIFSKNHPFPFNSGDTLGYLHKKDRFILNPDTFVKKEIDEEIAIRNTFFVTKNIDVNRKTKVVFCVSKLSDISNQFIINHTDTIYVLLERFLYKFHTDVNIFERIMIQISNSTHKKIIIKLPHLRSEFVDGTIRMKDLEGLEENQYNRNIDLYEPIFRSIRHLKDKEVYFTVPFIRDEGEFVWHRRDIEAFLQSLDIHINKIGTLLQTDSLSDKVSSINRHNKFDFAIIDSNEIFQEVYDTSRFSYFEYFEYIDHLYQEIRTLHENLNTRKYEQYFHGYLLSQPRLARKMYHSGIKNMIMYRSQAYNFYNKLTKSQVEQSSSAKLDQTK
jgi:hypothetical protein